MMDLFSCNRTLAAVIVLVFLIAFGLGFEHAYDYIAWHIPLGSIPQSEIHYMDDHVIGHPGASLTRTVSHVERTGDSLRITFNKNGFFTDWYKTPGGPEHVMTVGMDESFVSACHADATDMVWADIFRLAEMNNTHAVFNHYYTMVPPDVRCEYPEIIRHSLGVEFPLPEPLHDPDLARTVEPDARQTRTAAGYGTGELPGIPQADVNCDITGTCTYMQA